MRTAISPPCAPMLACLLAFGAAACANRGMEEPGDVADSGPGPAGSNGKGGRGGSGTAGTSAVGTGGVAGSTAGRAGAGGGTAGGGGAGTGAGGSGGTGATGGVTGSGGAGGTAGVGGTTGSAGRGGVAGSTAGTAGGIAGTGGTTAGRGGTTGTAGVGGTTGTAGAGGTTGSAGAGGTTGSAGRGGTTGSAGIGGVAGSTAGRGGSSAGAGGRGGGGGTAGGGASGAGGNMCPLGGVLDCSSSGALTLLPDGQVTDFSALEWNSSSGKWCDPRGLDGSIFAYAGATPSASTVAVDTTAQNLKLNLTVAATGYAGGGLTFDSCVSASGFTSVQFSAAITAGSLTGCSWQVQLQTQDQRPSSATNPSGGTCNPDAGASCYRFPTVATLAVPTTVATTYTEAFTLFDNPSSSATPTPTQVTGIQWQVNSGSSGAGTCTVELRIDSIKFQ